MKKIIFFLIIIISLLLIVFTLNKRIGKPTPVNISEVTTTGVVSLAASPTALSVSPGGSGSFTLNISVDPNQKVTGTAVELTYDPTALQIVSVTQGSFFPSTLSAANIADGKIAFTYAVDPSSGGKGGSGQVATINFKMLKTGSTNISFGTSSIATAIGFDNNVLKSATGLTISARGRADIYPVTQGDGTVNLLDYTQLVKDWGKSGNAGFIPSDIKTDGVINLLDYTLLVTDWNKTY